MDEKDIIIDACYIIGTGLLFKNSLDRSFFDMVQGDLSKEYDINLSQECVTNSVEEWKDFFRFSSDNTVILTKIGIQNKILVRCLFADALEPEIYEKVVNSILNKKPVPSRQKILRFPK